MAGDLYNVLDGLTVSQNDVTEAELLAQQILQAQYPDLDLRSGTGLADLTIRPSALALATVRAALNYYFANNTISQVTDNTDTDVVDSLLSNWFLTRNEGTYSVINVRLYFARQVTVTLTTDIWFSPDNTLLYYPSTTYSFAASALQFDSYSNEYYVDVNLTAAATGSTYDLSSGSLLYFSNFNAYFLQAEINYLVSSSTNAETNTQFVTRASTAISTRNLINVPSIQSNLAANFNYLSQIFPVGFGDAEMIRDQIYANITTPQPVTPTAVVYEGDVATITIPNHGFQTGQNIVASGGRPSLLNGGFSITVVDTNDFTYIMDSVPTVQVTNFPSIVPVYSPVLLHNGGCVDIYCGNSLASEITQLTTDANGNATLTGPVYSFSRSSVTGGSANDTIPFQNAVAYSSSTINQPGQVIQVAQTNHGLTTGEDVAISGLTETLTISSISCTGFTVTITTSTPHGLSTGSTVTVAGVTPTTYNGTYIVVATGTTTLTYTVAANIPTAGSGSAMQLINPNLSGSYAITVLGPNAYEIPVSTMWIQGTITGTLVIETNVPYTYQNTYAQVLNVASLTYSDGVVTVVQPNHGLSVGEYISIQGATPVGYDGSWVVQSVIDQNTYTYNQATTLSSPATGTITATSVIPWEDYGFSTEQSITISFGSEYANSTASFLVNYFNYLSDIQTYLEASANRVMCADLLARGFNFYLLNISLVAYNSATPDASTVTATVNTYLSSLAPGATFVMGDLISALTEAGITGIQTPIGVSYTNYTRYLVPPTTGTITDYLDPMDATSVFILNNVTTNSLAV
jgi:hypothetical protein